MKIKSVLLTMALAAFAPLAYAQAPTVSAPTPTHSPDKVKSAFSDTYTAFTKWDRQHGASMETITINGNDKVLKFSGDYVAVSLGGRKLNDMEYLHADVYAPASGGVSQVRFGFALFSGGEKYANDYNTDTPAGQWTSIDIPLSAFGGYDFSNTQVFRMTMTKTPGNTFYMDNVYFYTKDEGNTPTPTPIPTPTPGNLTHAPKPQHSAANVKSAFSDAYTSFTKWDRLHGASMEIVDLGDNDKVAKLSGDYVAISFGGRKLNDMEYMHADVFSPAEGGVSKVRFGFALFSGGEKYADDYNTATPAGQWTSIDIPLSAFKGYVFADTQVFRITMDKTKGNTFYLDNVYFYTTKGGTEQPTPPTPPPFDIKPAPIPTNDASTVKSVYCDVYTPACSFSNGGGNTGMVEEEVSINDTDKVRKLSAYNWIKYVIGTLDASDMTYLHIDVATPDGSDACASIQPVLVNGNSSFYTGSPELTKGKWTSLNIKLADFTAKGLDASAINEIRFKHSGNGSIAIDNIYFCKNEGAKGTTDANWGNSGGTPPPGLPPVAPVPTTDASDVKAFFSDAYPNLFGKFEIATYGEGKVEILDQAEGQQVCRITNFNWVPVNLGQRDVSDKGYVHFDFYTPADDAVASINVGFQNWNAANGSAYEIKDDEPFYRALEPGKWNSFDIPLSNFLNFDFATQMAVLRLRKGGSGKTLYVDNVYFWGKPGDVTGPEVPKLPDLRDWTAHELPPMDTPMLGVNLSSASGGKVPGTFGYDYMYPRLDDLAYFNGRKVKLIRLPFRAARFIEDIKNPAPDYANDSKSDVAAMKAVVAEAERMGIWVFLDAHDYAERTIDGTQYKIGEGEYTIERFAKMWGAIANEFKDYKNIWGYDLQNEPKVSAQVLLEAYQAAIDEIRKVDTNAQIIVEGTNWASAYEWIYGDRSDKQYPEYSTEVAWSYKQNSPWLLAKLKDPQNKLVFQAHGYFDADNSGTYQKGYSDVDYRKRFLPFLEWCKTNGAKGLIGEFGVPYPEHSTGDPRYLDLLDGALDLFREYQVCATYWCAGAMYESNSLTVQPDKSAYHGNYAVEKTTMKEVLSKYFTDWAKGSGVEGVSVAAPTEGDGRTYNLMGIEVDENYKGFVIRNGRKYLQK